MIADITLTAKPTALQVPEDISHDDAKRTEFFIELEQFGATGIDWMSADDFTIPHIAFNDLEGNLSIAFLGEYLVKWDSFPEIQVYSEERFWAMFQIPEPTYSNCLAGC